MRKTYCSIDNPFSANKMFTPIARGKMIKSQKYRDWIDKNLPILKDSLEPANKFPIELEFVLYSNYEWVRKNDIDNLIKPIVDLLVRAGIMPDDSARYIENISIRHVWMVGEPKLTIYYHQVEN